MAFNAGKMVHGILLNRGLPLLEPCMRSRLSVCLVSLAYYDLKSTAQIHRVVYQRHFPSSRHLRSRHASADSGMKFEVSSLPAVSGSASPCYLSSLLRILYSE